MKTAVLPTGEQMHFPDETPDEHMHAQVRAKLGMPPPENDAILLEQRLQQLTAAVAGLQQQMQQAATTYQQQMAQDRAMAQQQIAALGNSVHEQISTLAQAFQRQLAQVESVADNAVKLHANGERTGQLVERAISSSSAKLEATSRNVEMAAQNIAKAMNTPKKAVKQSDGSWKAVAC